MKDNINEATLEARIAQVLRTTFPTYEDVNVIHQKSFSIKFGHHEVTVDSKEPSKRANRAICDILLTIGEQNIILLELKREGLSISEEDVDQGISYARLTHPMPPLTLISNGNDNYFYNTYTKEKLDVTSVDMEYLQSLTDKSFKLALNDFKNAVSVLLNKDYEIFSKIINKISEEKFKMLLGEIGDFSKPICTDFVFERQLIMEIQTHFSNKIPLVGIIGSAFSGKTNILYKFFEITKSDNVFLLYLDCSDHNYSILQQLANNFTDDAKVLITKDQIREWLINSLSDDTDAKFYLLIDNFNNDIPEIIKSEIIELIDIFKGVNHHTLYTIDEYNYKKVAYVENRQYKTLIGNQSKLIRLNELNDEEYASMMNHLFTKYHIFIEHGGHYTPEYRELRILRHLVNNYNGCVNDDCCGTIDAVPNLELLNIFSENKTYTSQLHDLYKKIACCFIEEREYRTKDTDLGIIAFGTGAVSTGMFKNKFPDFFEILLRSSFIVLREISEGVSVIYPKIPELVAKYAIDVIYEMILDEHKLKKDYNDICKFFIKIIEPIPFNDIVGTGVLMKIAENGFVDLFSELVQELLNLPPHKEIVSKGTKALMYSENVGSIEVDFEDDTDNGSFISNFLPYIILSQLARYPLGLIEDNEHSKYAFHVYLLNKVGSSNNILRRADVRSIQNMKPLKTYALKGVGEVICGKEGIIEPFVQSIQVCFSNITNDIELLYERAFKEDNFLLLWRIYLALKNLCVEPDTEYAIKIDKFLSRFKIYIYSFMSELLTKDLPDDKTKIELKEMLSNIDLSEINK
jgi:hypothetical protein